MFLIQLIVYTQYFFQRLKFHFLGSRSLKILYNFSDKLCSAMFSLMQTDFKLPHSISLFRECKITACCPRVFLQIHILQFPFHNKCYNAQINSKRRLKRMHTLSLHFFAQQSQAIKFLVKNDLRLAKISATIYLKHVHIKEFFSAAFLMTKFPHPQPHTITSCCLEESFSKQHYFTQFISLQYNFRDNSCQDQLNTCSHICPTLSLASANLEGHCLQHLT